jgi:hypothetical protein
MSADIKLAALKASMLMKFNDFDISLGECAALIRRLGAEADSDEELMQIVSEGMSSFGENMALICAVFALKCSPSIKSGKELVEKTVEMRDELDSYSQIIGLIASNILMRSTQDDPRLSFTTQETVADKADRFDGLIENTLTNYEEEFMK